MKAKIPMRWYAAELLMNLRGMAREELCSDEITFVQHWLEEMCSSNYARGFSDGVKHKHAVENQGPSCETCSDGGHEHG